MANFTLSVQKYTPNILYTAGYLLMALSAFSQSQGGGSYPSIQGGFEKFSASSLGQVSDYAPGSQYSSYFINTGTNNSASFSPSAARTGSRMLTWKPGGDNNSLFTPTVTNNAFKNSTYYTIQFYYATSSDNPFAGGRTPVVAISTDGTQSPGVGPKESTDIDFTTAPDSWIKKTIVVRSGSSANPNKYGSLIFTSNNIGSNAIYFDDLTVYEGDVEDDIAPESPLNATAVSASSSSVSISWNAPGSGVDGGGYMVLRSLRNDTLTPNINGIYGKGNNIGSGTVEYVGNKTSFTDEGLTQGLPYYYSVYTFDKAFNYSPVANVICIPQAQGFASVLTGSITIESGTVATATGNVIADGGSGYPIIKRGIVWATHSDPVIDTDSSLLSGSGMGNFAGSIKNLLLGSSYYVRAYAITAAGISYGQNISTTTFTWPVIGKTSPVSWLSFSSITTGVTVDSTGGDITTRGVCWNTSGMPTINDSTTIEASLYGGTSVINIEYLLPHTTYYVRGYATNKVGTVYGPQIVFRTLSVYYNVAGADISKLSGWNTMPDGSGIAPLNFTADSFAYNIRNARSFLGADLTITGKASRIVLGAGFDSIKFIFPDDHVYNGLIDVRNAGILYIKNKQNPKYNFLYEGSTINFDGPESLTIPNGVKFYNIGSTSDSGITRILPAGTVLIAGSFSPGKANYSIHVADTLAFISIIDRQIIPAFQYQSLTNYNAVSQGDVIVKKYLGINRRMSVPYGSSLIVEDGSSILIKKSLTVTGLFENRNTAKLLSVENDAKIIIKDSGIYKINGYEGNKTFTANGFEFSPGSILYIATGQPALPAHIGGSVVWDTKASQGNKYSSTPLLRTSGGDNTIIDGSLIIKNTGTGALNNGWNGTTGKKLIVKGNLQMQGGEYDVNASPQNCEPQGLTVKGDLIVTGGKLFTSVSNYSGGVINVLGNLLHTDGEFGAQGNITNGKLSFNGNVQQLIRTKGLSNAVSVVVDNSEGVTMMTDLSVNSTDTSALLLKNGTLHIKSNILTVKGGLKSDSEEDGSSSLDAAAGTLILNGTSTQHLSCNILNSSIKNLKINNNKNVSTQVSLIIETLTFDNGKLLIADNNVSCNSIINFNKDRYIVTNGKGNLKINNVDSRKGAVIFPVGPSEKSYNPLTLRNKGRLDNYAINVKSPFDLAGLTMDTSGVVNVQYSVAEDVKGGSNVDLTLQWNNENENSGFKTTNEGGAVVIGQWVDSFWLKSQVKSLGQNPYSVSVENIPYVTTFVIGNLKSLINTVTPLLGVTSFYGNENGNNVDLFWNTNIEVDVKEYVIERSINSIDFKNIGSVKANGFGWEHDYKYVDSSAPGGIVYYRLKIINTDGSYFYSRVITIVLKREVKFAVFPNPVPAGGSINILHNLSGNSAFITVTSASGVKAAYSKVPPGSIQSSFNCSSLPQGVYILQYENNGIRKATMFMKSDE